MLQREFLSLRDAELGGDGRTVVLACVPFDVPATVDDGDGPYREVFRHGAFRHVVNAPNRVELRYAHQAQGAPYGFGVDLVEDPKYLLGSFRVAPSAQGDQVLALVGDGQLNGVSIGYVPGQSREGRDEAGRLVERMRVKRLAEVSLTPAPAYLDGAHVLAVREDGSVFPDRHAAMVERERLRWARLRADL